MEKPKVWSWFLYNGRWALALLLAGIFSLWTKRGLIRIYRAFALWFGLLHHRKDNLVDDETLALRLKTCESCPIFYRPLRTCGTPVVKELRHHGCWCYMMEAAKLHEKQCYLDADISPGYPGGWEHAVQQARDSKPTGG
jgi:hypothetical protein